MTMITLTVRPWSRPPESVKPQGTAEECRVSVSSEVINSLSFNVPNLNSMNPGLLIA